MWDKWVKWPKWAGGGGAAPATYKITGQINDADGAGLDGVTVNLTGDATDSTTTAGGGAYEFSGLAAGNYTVTPSKVGSTFSPASAAVTITVADKVATTMAEVWQITGVIKDGDGVGLDGVTVNLTGDASDSTTTAGGGAYAFTGLSNGSYTVTPSKVGSTFSPTSRNVTVTDANAVAGDMAEVWEIAGTITVGGSPLEGVLVTLSGDASDTDTTDSNGDYSFPGLSNGSYTVTPTKTGYTFTPTSSPETVADANVDSDFTATAVWTISGTIEDGDTNPLSGVLVTLSGDASDTDTTDGSGNYSFEVSDGSYTLTPTKTDYLFDPESTDVTVSGGDQTGKDFTGYDSMPSEAWQSSGSGTALIGAIQSHTGNSDVCLSFWLYMNSTSTQCIYDIFDNSSGFSYFFLEYDGTNKRFDAGHRTASQNSTYRFNLSDFPSALVDGSGHIKTGVWFHLTIVHRYTPNCSVNNGTPFSATNIGNQGTPFTGTNTDTGWHIGRYDSGTNLASGGRVAQFRVIYGSTDIATFRAGDYWQRRIIWADEGAFLYDAWPLEWHGNSEIGTWPDLTLGSGSYTTGDDGPTLYQEEFLTLPYNYNTSDESPSSGGVAAQLAAWTVQSGLVDGVITTSVADNNSYTPTGVTKAFEFAWGASRSGCWMDLPNRIDPSATSIRFAWLWYSTQNNRAISFANSFGLGAQRNAGATGLSYYGFFPSAGASWDEFTNYSYYESATQRNEYSSDSQGANMDSRRYHWLRVRYDFVGDVVNIACVRAQDNSQIWGDSVAMHSDGQALGRVSRDLASVKFDMQEGASNPRLVRFWIGTDSDSWPTT